MTKIKRCLVFILGVLLAFSTPLATSTCLAKEYEDLYAKNGKIDSRPSEEHAAIYTVNNHAGMNQHLTMYFVVQDYFEVKQNDFLYKFVGKLSPTADYFSRLGFEFDLGMPIEYNQLDTVVLGDETAILYQTQFGIYPGYYNFYHYGNNYLAWDAQSNVCYIKTLSPNFVLKEEDEEAEHLWVEIEEGVDPRIYAIIGEKEWIEKVEADFEIWAVEYEELTAEIIANSVVQEEVTEEVPEASSEEVLVENSEVLSETTTQPSEEMVGQDVEEPVVSEENIVTPSEKPHTYAINWEGVAVLAAGAAVVAILGVLGFKAIKKR